MLLVLKTSFVITSYSIHYTKLYEPRKYKSPEEFDAKVEEYADYCKEQDEPVTWTGLALFLGFCSRQSIDEYLQYDGFSDSVKRAKRNNFV